MSDFTTRTLNPKSFSLDASMRMRVSKLTTLDDYKTLRIDEVLLMENTSTWSNNMYQMSVTEGQYLIRK